MYVVYVRVEPDAETADKYDVAYVITLELEAWKNEYPPEPLVERPEKELVIGTARTWFGPQIPCTHLRQFGQ